MKLIRSLIFCYFVPLLIIIKTGEGSFSCGSSIKKVYDEYKMIGIVVATTNYPYNKDAETRGYCCYSIVNTFNTKILVLCCNSSLISKWSTQVTNYSSSLSRDGEVEKVNRIERYPNRVLNSDQPFLVNKGFRIAIPKDLHLIRRYGNRLYGYLGEIIMELSAVMNFSISQVLEEPSGFFQSNTSNWTGIFGAVAQGKADIGAAAFIMTSERLAVVDFSLPIMRVKYTLFIAQSIQSSIQWNGFFKVFHPKIWMVIVFSLLITPLLLVIIEYKKGCNLLDIISMHYLNVWGLYCLQSWSSPPREKPSKIIFLSLFMSTLVVNAGYSAALIRHLTTAPPYVPFRTIQEFVNDGTYKVILVRDSAIHVWLQKTNDTLMRKVKTLMKPSDSLPITRAEAIEQLCTQRVALAHAKLQENLQSVNQCSIMALPLGGTFNVGLILPLGSEYTRLVNHHIRRLRENGVLNRLKRKYSAKSDPVDTSYDSVTFKDMLPILIIFAAGCSLALIIFSQERR